LGNKKPDSDLSRARRWGWLF